MPKRKKSDDEKKTKKHRKKRKCEEEKKVETPSQLVAHTIGAMMESALAQQTDTSHLPRSDRIDVFMARLLGRTPTFLDAEQFKWKEEVRAEWLKEYPPPPQTAPIRGLFGCSESYASGAARMDWEAMSKHPSTDPDSKWCEETDRFYTCKPLYTAHLRQKFWKEKPYLLIVQMAYIPDRVLQKNSLCISILGHEVLHGVFTIKICNKCNRMSLFFKTVCMCEMPTELSPAMQSLLL
jgi:hypothetical protein